MNIFSLADDPVDAAIAQCDQHIRKMDIETGQLLSTTVRLVGASDPDLYHSTHDQHPSRRWAGATRGNFDWLVEHGLALVAERALRGYAPSRAEAAILAAWRQRGLIPAGPRLPFSRGSKTLPFSRDMVKAYRVYYREQKQRFATWARGREAPDWWTQDQVVITEPQPAPEMAKTAREVWEILWHICPDEVMPQDFSIRRLSPGWAYRSRGAWSWAGATSDPDRRTLWVLDVGSQWGAGRCVRWWRRDQLSWAWDFHGQLQLDPTPDALSGD